MGNNPQLKFGKYELYNIDTKRYCVIGALGRACGFSKNDMNLCTVGDYEILLAAKRKFGLKTSLRGIEKIESYNDADNWGKVNNWLRRNNLWHKLKKYAINIKEISNKKRK